MKKIYEIARKYKVSPLEAVDIFNRIGIQVRNHMSKVSDEDIEKFLLEITDINSRPEFQQNTEKSSFPKNNFKLKETPDIITFVEKYKSYTRVTSPLLDELEELPTKLEPGELEVLEFFLSHLEPAWEIYIQPHLNGLRPDFVLLHPSRGIAVFEVKDWDLSKMDYHFKGDKLFATKNGKTFSVESKNPFPKIMEYADLIYHLFCPSLGKENKKDYRIISKGVIFTKATKSQILNLFEERYRKEMSYPSFNVVSKEDLESMDILRVFKNHHKNDSLMNHDVAHELRGWLVEPEFSKEQRAPITLNPKQKKLSTTRALKTGLRRIKGAGGSGKTLVLAARAVNLATKGERVLFCTFNITLLNYLRDLCVRFIRNKGVLQNIEFYHYHAWSKKVCLDTGDIQEYHKLSNKLDPSALVSDILKSEDFCKYDAILVDEGQDYNLDWWNSLRQGLVDGGEMVLAADPTQDVYGTAAAWTEESMSGAGFVGDWTTLEASYRMPVDYVPLVKEFVEAFILKDEFCILPQAIQSDLFDKKTEIKWCQVDESNLLDKSISEILAFNSETKFSRSWADLVILCDRKSDGKFIVDELENHKIRVIHTFYDSDEEEKRRKRAFYKGDARVKATTIHSFKGWEATSIIINISSSSNVTPALVYTALTRLKRSGHGSSITVICSHEHYSEYGKKWSKDQTS